MGVHWAGLMVGLGGAFPPQPFCDPAFKSPQQNRRAEPMQSQDTFTWQQMCVKGTEDVQGLQGAPEVGLGVPGLLSMPWHPQELLPVPTVPAQPVLLGAGSCSLGKLCQSREQHRALLSLCRLLLPPGAVEMPRLV